MYVMIHDDPSTSFVGRLMTTALSDLRPEGRKQESDLGPHIKKI